MKDKETISKLDSIIKEIISLGKTIKDKNKSVMKSWRVFKKQLNDNPDDATISTLENNFWEIHKSYEELSSKLDNIKSSLEIIKLEK